MSGLRGGVGGEGIQGGGRDPRRRTDGRVGERVGRTVTNHACV